MPKYVMLSTLGPDGFARIRENPERIREVSTEVEAMGVKVLHQYALLGTYDFLTVLEAPDEFAVSKVATTLASTRHPQDPHPHRHRRRGLHRQLARDERLDPPERAAMATDVVERKDRREGGLVRVARSR